MSNILLKSISNHHLSLRDLQHITFHVTCRSQKTSLLQKQSGLNAHLIGLSLTGLAAVPVIGFSKSPRTVLKYKYDLHM